MAAIGQFIDGAYIGTYNSVGIGITQDGYDLILSLKEEVINESDQYGNSLLDYFYKGGDCQIRCDSKEYAPGSVAPYWPWGAWGQMTNAALPIGRKASAVAKSLVLTSTAGTPAATAPASLTATMAVLAPGQSSTLKFSTKLRTVPIFLQLLPDQVAGDTRWFTTT